MNRDVELALLTRLPPQMKQAAESLSAWHASAFL